MIELKEISKRIKGQIILENISLTIKQGKCYGFVGYNGCGKTMLLRAICGYMKIDSGKIYVNEKELGRELDFVQNAGIILGESQFMNSLTGFENLKILAEIQHLIDDRRIYQVLAKMGLQGAAKKKVRQYSLGMKQRLRLAQAFMEDPEILILDEPFNALDNSGVREIQSLLLEEKEKGKTILLTSHDERHIRLLCDYVYEMESGKIVGKRRKSI